MARRPDREKAEILSENDLKELRYSLAHLSQTAVRDFYERAYGDCASSTTVSRLPGRCRRSCRCGSSCGSGDDRRKEMRHKFCCYPSSRTGRTCPEIRSG